MKLLSNPILLSSLVLVSACQGQKADQISASEVSGGILIEEDVIDLDAIEDLGEEDLDEIEFPNDPVTPGMMGTLVLQDGSSIIVADCLNGMKPYLNDSEHRPIINLINSQKQEIHCLQYFKPSRVCAAWTMNKNISGTNKNIDCRVLLNHMATTSPFLVDATEVYVSKGGEWNLQTFVKRSPF